MFPIHGGSNFAFQKVAAMLFLRVQVNPRLINHNFLVSLLMVQLKNFAKHVPSFALESCHLTERCTSSLLSNGF